MKIKTKMANGNVVEASTGIHGIECDGEDTVAFGAGGDSVRLTRGELKRLVAANAPYCADARAAFFAELAEFADQTVPTY